MVNKTYKLKPEDANKLISYAERYRSIRTRIDQNRDTMTVSTTFVDNPEPTSIADRFDLDKVSDNLPKMPKDEYERRVEGKFPQENK